jgi:hypothetical protein
MNVLVRTRRSQVTRVGAEADSGSGKIILVTGLLAAAAILFVMKSDVSSQREWNVRYGVKR